MAGSSEHTKYSLPAPLLVGFVLLVLLSGPALSGDIDPWRALDELRASLRSQSPISARFSQTFLPAGFSEGEVEDGVLGISLPHCLRWDYGEPFPKSFLLCDDIAYYWNPGEVRGRKYPVESEETPGLDFFLLRSDQLSERYKASSHEEADGIRIELLPIHPTDDITELDVLLDRKREQLLQLRYRDAEGNLTEFVMSEYRRGARPEQFTPPADVEWEEP